MAKNEKPKDKPKEPKPPKPGKPGGPKPQGDVETPGKGR